MSILGMIRLSVEHHYDFMFALGPELEPGLPVLKANLLTATPKVSTLQAYLEYSETINITFICQTQYHQFVVEATQRTISILSMIYSSRICLQTPLRGADQQQKRDQIQVILTMNGSM